MPGPVSEHRCQVLFLGTPYQETGPGTNGGHEWRDAVATFGRIDGTVYPAELVHQVSLASLKGEFARITTCSEIKRASLM